MSENSSRKREGEELNNGPPEKVGVVPDPEYDVILVVEGQKFYCLKEKLADSDFLKNMFTSAFKEKEQKEIELGMVKPHTFQLFLDFIEGVNSVTDENVEEAMTLVDYLQAPKLETQCLEHLSQRSELTQENQFILAENSHSEKLVHQIMSSINDLFKFDEVVPNDLNSLDNNHKSIVLQKAFELLGHRKPTPPPLEPEKTFEHMVDEVLDQIEVQNHHGQILADQCNLLYTYVLIEQLNRSAEIEGIALDEINSNADTKELTNQRHLAYDALERNYYEARIQLGKLKRIYTAVDNADPEAIGNDKEMSLDTLRDILFKFPKIIERSKRNNAGVRELAVGNLPIDGIYRNLVAEIENAQFVPILSNKSQWLESIEADAVVLKSDLENVPIPVGLRQISVEANCIPFDNFIRNIRNTYYGLVQVEQQHDEQN